MIAHQHETDKALPLFAAFQALVTSVHDAASQGTPVHKVEKALWQQLLVLGHQTLGYFFQLQGSGDLGDAVQLPDGQSLHRLEQPHQRAYRSVFGDFRLSRTVYGSRESQKIELVPLDTRLQLPDSDYSYLLQDWDQLLGVEQAFGRVAATLFDMLGVKQSVDSLETMNRHTAQQVAAFRDSRPAPVPEDEGEVVVVQADGKGIVMRRTPEGPAIAGHRKKGDKANQKRMATVGGIYSIDRHVRTAADIIESLFRDPQQPKPKSPPRPEPCQKQLWACLSSTVGDEQINGMSVVFGWLTEELGRRNPGCQKETVYLMDGQASLWKTKRILLPAENSVEILELLHVTPRLWEAAHLFEKEGSDAALGFVKEQLRRVLQGEVTALVRGWRRRANREGLSASRRKRLGVICRYLLRNKEKMQYDVYLARGYPIASGVIEGACRHYVKDRMERAGMHWTQGGAQAMLDVRSIYVNGDWEEFQKFRIERETERLYPHRQLIEDSPWALAV
jgi:hypothetical protein